jgi:hypothetical protein
MLIDKNELWISGPDYKVGDLSTVEQCDKAIALLTSTIADIEGRLALPEGEPDWRRRAQRTLSMRKAARQEVYRLRKNLLHLAWQTWEHVFVGVVKELDPALFTTALAVTDERSGVERRHAA